MKSLRAKTALITILAVAGLFAIYLFTRQQSLKLGNPTTVTGYASLCLMILLALFNTRKKLSMIPFIQARVWLMMHIIFGVTMLLLYWLHTGNAWPTGVYEQIIAALFYLVCITGIIGYILSRTTPSRLRLTGNEIIYERIPTEIYSLRETVKDEITKAVEFSGNETLSREYEESLAWFFSRPRFFLSHISGSGRPLAWVQSKAESLKPFLSREEEEKFDSVLSLMNYKNQIDAHYFNQKLLKLWLFLHLPLTVALMVFVGWHVLLVHLYSI